MILLFAYHRDEVGEYFDEETAKFFSYLLPY
jgi:hypothetical protein